MPFGNCLAFCALYLIKSNVVLVSCCTSKTKKRKKEIYIKYIYTDLSLHKTALVKGYIFPLQLKINKMVSNIPQNFLFVFLVFPVKGEPISDFLIE